MPAALLLALQALSMLAPMIPELKDDVTGLIGMFKGGQAHLTEDELKAIGARLDDLKIKADAAIAERLKTVG